MANEYETPPRPPNPLLATSGRRITSRLFTDLCDGYNRALAEVGAANIVDQAWQDDLCRWSGAVKPVGQWRIPSISDRHTTAQVELWAESITEAGVVEVESAETSDVAIFNPAAGGPALYSAPLDVGVPEAGYGDLIFRLGNTSGGEVRVHAVVVRYLPLASPLGAQLISGAEPIGITGQGEDRPLPAATGQIIREGLEVVRRRPRVLLCWTGLSGLEEHSGASERLPHMYPLQHLVRVHPGALDAGVRYTAWVRARRQEKKSFIRVQALADRQAWTRTINEIEVPAGEGVAWFDIEFELPEGGRLRGYRNPVAAVGVEAWVGDPLRVPMGRSSAPILSASIWGE